MIHFIKQHSTLPKLKLQLYSSSSNTHSTSEYMRCLTNSTITFDMYDTECKQKVIACRKARLEEIQSSCIDCQTTDYVIVIDWQPLDTSQKGTYRGEIKIVFNETGETLIAPLSEELIIKIV